MALRASPTRPRGRWRQGLASTRKAPNRTCLWSQPASLHASTAVHKHCKGRSISTPEQVQRHRSHAPRAISNFQDMTWKARLGSTSPTPIHIGIGSNRWRYLHGEILRFTSTLRTFRVSQSTDREAVTGITEGGSGKIRRPVVNGRTTCTTKLAEQVIVGGRQRGTHHKGWR